MDKETVYALIDKHYRVFSTRIFKNLIGQTGGVQNAEDVMQEGYARACLYWKTFDETQPFNTWMNVIVANAAKDCVAATYMAGMVMDENMGANTAYTTIRLQEVLDEIAFQPPHIGRILKFALLEGYTSVEIAMFVSETAFNVRKIVERFRRDYL